MSVIVKGMEMPTHCLDCPFMVSRDNDDCILQSDEANEGFENWEQMKNGCPLAPIPPHGDLIDRSKLPWNAGWLEVSESCHDHITFVYVNDLFNAPTVIEEET